MSLLFNLKNLLLPQSDKQREFWVAKKLKKIKKGSKIIDAGAGECYYKKYCKHLKYVSQDFGKYNGKGDSVGIQTGKRDSSKLDIVSDIVNIPVKKESFDATLCVEVFEHIPRHLPRRLGHGLLWPSYGSGSQKVPGKQRNRIDWYRGAKDTDET